jgi:hypothetical protein
MAIASNLPWLDFGEKPDPMLPVDQVQISVEWLVMLE